VVVEMSKQATLTSFFHARKATADGADLHAIKKRKVELQDDLGKNTTTVKAEPTKLMPAPEIGEQTPEASSKKGGGGKTQPQNGRRRKAEAMSKPLTAQEAKQPPLFTVGATTSNSKAKRKLNMDNMNSEDGTKEDDSTPASNSRSRVSFQQKGLLSPSKKAKPSPAKRKDEEVAPKQATKPATSLMDKLNQMDSKEVKAKIKTVNKLADLQAQLKSLKNDTNVKKAASQNNIKRALFQDDQKKAVKEEPKVPLMSPKKMPREAMAAASTLPKPVMSPGKASPRKSIPAFVRYQELAQPDKFLPLPNRYKALTEIFRSVDVIVSMKFNRKEMIRVPDLKPAVQNITRKNFSEFYLRQIRCVFPKAYRYIWEKMNDRLGRHTGDYVLHMAPDHGIKGTAASGGGMSPLVKVERLKMFSNALLNIVHDYHRDFLASIGISGIQDSQVTKWHKDFSLETVPDIEEEPLPPKPEVETIGRSAKDMLTKLAGVNERLEASLKNIKQAAVSGEADGVKKEGGEGCGPPPAIRKELRGLPPHLIQKILANEKAKQIKEMTQSSDDRKDLEALEDLLTLAPVIINCHRAHKKGAAVPMDVLAQVTADSCGRKSKQAMLPLIRLFLTSVPECMELKTIERVQYVKLKKTSPDINQVKKMLEDLVTKAKNKI